MADALEDTSSDEYRLKQFILEQACYYCEHNLIQHFMPDDITTFGINPILPAMAAFHSITTRHYFDHETGKAVSLLQFIQSQIPEPSDSLQKEYIDILISLKSKAVFYEVFSSDFSSADDEQRQAILDKYFSSNCLDESCCIPEECSTNKEYDLAMHTSVHRSIKNLLSSKDRRKVFQQDTLLNCSMSLSLWETLAEKVENYVQKIRQLLPLPQLSMCYIKCKEAQMLKKGGEDVEDSAIDEGSGDPNDQHSSSQIQSHHILLRNPCILLQRLPLIKQLQSSSSDHSDNSTDSSDDESYHRRKNADSNSISKHWSRGNGRLRNRRPRLRYQLVKNADSSSDSNEDSSSQSLSLGSEDELSKQVKHSHISINDNEDIESFHSESMDESTGVKNKRDLKSPKLTQLSIQHCKSAFDDKDISDDRFLNISRNSGKKFSKESHNKEQMDRGQRQSDDGSTTCIVMESQTDEPVHFLDEQSESEVQLVPKAKEVKILHSDTNNDASDSASKDDCAIKHRRSDMQVHEEEAVMDWENWQNNFGEIKEHSKSTKQTTDKTPDHQQITGNIRPDPKRVRVVLSTAHLRKFLESSETNSDDLSGVVQKRFRWVNNLKGTCTADNSVLSSTVSPTSFNQNQTKAKPQPLVDPTASRDKAPSDPISREQENNYNLLWSSPKEVNRSVTSPMSNGGAVGEESIGADNERNKYLLVPPSPLSSVDTALTNASRPSLQMTTKKSGQYLYTHVSRVTNQQATTENHCMVPSSDSEKRPASRSPTPTKTSDRASAKCLDKSLTHPTVKNQRGRPCKTALASSGVSPLLNTPSLKSSPIPGKRRGRPRKTASPLHHYLLLNTPQLSAHSPVKIGRKKRGRPLKKKKRNPFSLSSKTFMVNEKRIPSKRFIESLGFQSSPDVAKSHQSGSSVKEKLNISSSPYLPTSKSNCGVRIGAATSDENMNGEVICLDETDSKHATRNSPSILHQKEKNPSHAMQGLFVSPEIPFSSIQAQKRNRRTCATMGSTSTAADLKANVASRAEQFPQQKRSGTTKPSIPSSKLRNMLEELGPGVLHHLQGMVNTALETSKGSSHTSASVPDQECDIVSDTTVATDDESPLDKPNSMLHKLDMLHTSISKTLPSS